MLPFAIYFVTGIITGYHLYALISFALYGAPFNLLELLALLGSLCLLIASYISLFRPYAAARVALIACIVMWSFYGPAMAKIVRAKSIQARIVPAKIVPAQIVQAKIVQAKIVPTKFQKTAIASQVVGWPVGVSQGPEVLYLEFE